MAAPRAPSDFDVNGIRALGMSMSTGTGSLPQPLEESTCEFTGLAFAIHLGMTMLESPRGKGTLSNLGRLVTREWQRKGNFQFQGDTNQMGEYVNTFLRTARNDFFRVVVAPLGGPEVIAEARRSVAGGNWDGNLNRYRPKYAGGIYFDANRVAAMADASIRGAGTDPVSRKMAARWRSYLFMFAVATAHELTHLFVAYLAGGSNDNNSRTPPEVSHLNYWGSMDEDGRPETGESGRWLENQLFGGSVEFYRDVRDDANQTGIPHVLDSERLARKIHPDCIYDLLRQTSSFNQYPFRTTGNALTTQDRRSRGLLALSSSQAESSQQSTQMRARRERRPPPLFSLSAQELNRIPLQPGYIARAVRIA